MTEKTALDILTDTGFATNDGHWAMLESGRKELEELRSRLTPTSDVAGLLDSLAERNFEIETIQGLERFDRKIESLRQSIASLQAERDMWRGCAEYAIKNWMPPEFAQAIPAGSTPEDAIGAAMEES